MNITDIKTDSIKRIHSASPEEVRNLLLESRQPLIFSGLNTDFEFLKKWNLEFFSQLDTKVPVQKPEPDGVNYFVNYQQMHLSEFVNKINDGENLYIGAREIMTAKGSRSDKDGLGKLASQLKIPSWIDKNNIYSSNLWIGAGRNHTLLHYDPWNSILMLAEGKKEFIVIPDTYTSKLYPYSAFNFKALTEGRVLHSRISPLNVEKRFQSRFSTVKGLSGTISAGEMIFIPAGFWHYVKSTNTNIGINFFVHVRDPALHKKEPLRTYWIKDKITLVPVRLYMQFKYIVFKAIRFFIPKKNTTAT